MVFWGGVGSQSTSNKLNKLELSIISLINGAISVKLDRAPCMSHGSGPHTYHMTAISHVCHMALGRIHIT